MTPDAPFSPTPAARLGVALVALVFVVAWHVGREAGAAGGAASQPALVARTPFVFVLPRDATTSAGVYDASGRLVRTLWSAETLSAGEHRRSWDGRDDDGADVAPGTVEIRVLHHRISYVWEGVIGNSSDAFGGAVPPFRGYLPPASVAVSGSRIYYAMGYNEGQPGVHAFDSSSPGKDQPLAASNDPFAGFAMVAVDERRVYAASTGGYSRTSFVAAFDLRTARRTPFASGTPLCLQRHPTSGACYPDQDYPAVVDIEPAAADAPTGLAVQRSGRLLAVAHGGKGIVRLYDKATGAAVASLAVSLHAKAVNQLAFAPGGDLWVISGHSVLRYADLERAPVVVARIDGLERPLAIGAGAAGDDVVWVADGGASQQLKRFDARGVAGPVIGVAGGYAREPAVGTSKLCFLWREGREGTAVGVADDGAVWVVDSCNNRMLRVRVDAARGTWSDAQVAFLPAVYLSTVDHAAPHRVFANFLEFEVDGTAPLRPRDSWRLVRNWLAGLPASLRDEHAFNGGWGGLVSVETLSNARTYGIVRAFGRQSIVELPPAGPLRVIRQLAAPLPGSTEKVLYENGDLGWAVTGGTTQTVLRLPLTGFDAAGDPVWSTDPQRLASVPIGPRTPHYRGAFSGMPPRFPVTASGSVVFFDSSVEGNEGFHLGAAKIGTDTWLWQASPSGPLDGKGRFQTKAVDRSVNYGGNVVWASGRHIVYGYHGESYRDLQTGRVGQASQFMHFDESGLFIGQFGQPSTRPAGAMQEGLSGNAFSPTLVRDGPRLYLYHNDEWAHGGVHRWRIDGWEDVGELRGRGAGTTEIDLRQVRRGNP